MVFTPDSLSTISWCDFVPFHWIHFLFNLIVVQLKQLDEVSVLRLLNIFTTHSDIHYIFWRSFVKIRESYISLFIICMHIYLRRYILHGFTTKIFPKIYLFNVHIVKFNDKRKSFKNKFLINDLECIFRVQICKFIYLCLRFLHCNNMLKALELPIIFINIFNFFKVLQNKE